MAWTFTLSAERLSALVALSDVFLSPATVAIVTATIAAAVGVVAIRRRENPVAWPLAVLMVGIALWALFSAVGYLDPSRSLLWDRLEYIGIAVAPIAYLFVALRYAGYESWFTLRVYAIASIIPVLTVLVALTNPWHQLLWQVTASDPLVVENAPWFWVVRSYSYVAVAVGLFVLASVALNANPMYGKQSALMFAGGLAPLALDIAEIAGLLPAPAIGLTVPALTVSGVTFAIALFHYDVLDISPAAYQNVSTIFGDGVLVFDRDCRLIDGNDHAEHILETHVEAGMTAEELFDDSADQFDGTCDGSVGMLDGTVLTRTNGSRRFYRIRYEPIEDNQGRVVGHVVVMREVTDLKKHEQRLEVTNRILRHNLRNELNVIIGQTTLLEESLPGKHPELDSIRDAAYRLNALGEKARDIQSSMAWGEDHQNRVNLAPAAEAVVADYCDRYPDATVTFQGPDKAFVRAPSAGVLRTVVGNLVENGIEHNDCEPRVDVEVGVACDTVTLRVTDDGPGIPATEVDVLRHGEETDLQHGSGLGLWLVYWFVSSIGGDISFGRDNGTVVEVHLQRATEPVARRTSQEQATPADD